ncbi:L,D-transpeptidase [Nitrobacter sp. TKz-YC02]|uniref:L,D-transpeptidase n=1 Tax=Nitrobacter sp. TKz-YC02 TaxID=3398704 RepID=UPI003CF47309
MSEYLSFLRTMRWTANVPSVFVGPYLWSVRLGIGLLIAVLTGLGSPAHSQIFWQDDYPDFFNEGSPPPPVTRSQSHGVKVRRLPKPESAAKVTRKPNGPIIIAISIRRQMLKVYDANGLFAETPVSTGMSGHGTPMGVFSVIQKQKWHRSNIYSGAPMPYMQRITWSGIAMHAGVLPGYPASHGCIRMPLDFAVKMWNWTRIGARVIITPGEVTPADFSHPVLTSRRPEPVPAEVKADAAAMSQVKVSSLASGLSATGGSITATPEAAAAEPIKGDSGNTRDTDVTVTAAANPVGDTVASPAEIPAGSENQPQTPPASAEKAELAAISALKRSGRIAVFVSGKDSKIYVRQNFTPIFDAPITIAASDRPLGTHVFTAEVAKDSKADFRWSVVSLPALERRADRVHVLKGRSGQKTTVVNATVRPTPVPDSATDALNRISIPENVMAQIAIAFSTGDSIVVSDQSIAGGETGEGTDFIVGLR